MANPVRPSQFGPFPIITQEMIAESQALNLLPNREPVTSTGSREHQVRLHRWGQELKCPEHGTLHSIQLNGVEND